MAKRESYGILPVSVRHNKSLSDGAKVLYAEITTLSAATGYCWATNEYFAQLFGKGQRTITRYISELQQYGHIQIDISYKDYRAVRKIFITAIENTSKHAGLADPREHCDPTEEEARRVLGW
jgi:hypothetical protein